MAKSTIKKKAAEDLNAGQMVYVTKNGGAAAYKNKDGKKSSISSKREQNTSNKP